MASDQEVPEKLLEIRQVSKLYTVVFLSCLKLVCFHTVCELSAST